MSAVKVQDYLHMDDMEEGTSKKDLQTLVETVDDDNKGYVMKQLQKNFDSYASSHVHEDLRNMEVVMRRVRQEFALKNLPTILSDYTTMAKFVPDVKVEDAHGMSSEDAQALLDQLCPTTLNLFETNLKSHLEGVRTSIIEENPMLAEEGGEVIVEDMVAENKRKAFYNELQAALAGPKKTIAWKFVPKVNPSELATEAEKAEALRWKDMVTKDNVEAIEKQFAEALTAQKKKLALKPTLEKQFDVLFAKKQYWSIVKQVLKQASCPEGKKVIPLTVDEDKMKSSIPAASKPASSFNPFRKRKAGEISPGSSMREVDNCKQLHQCSGSIFNSRCYLLQAPVKMDGKDSGSDSESYSIVVGDAVGLCQVELTGMQGVNLANAIMEAWNADADGEESISPVIEVKNFRVCDYKNPSQIKKLVQEETSSLTILSSEAPSAFKMDETIVTALTKLQAKLWLTTCIEGMACKVEETKTSDHGSTYKNFTLVDTFGNYVPCLAMGAAACSNLEERLSSPNAVVMLCFVQPKPPKHNPQYPNSNGKVWFYGDSFIFETSKQQSKPDLKREINLRALKQ